jgi:hypothetical protein
VLTTEHGVVGWQRHLFRSDGMQRCQCVKTRELLRSADDGDDGDVLLRWSGHPDATLNIILRNNLHACDNPLHTRGKIVDIDNGDMDSMDFEMSMITSLTSDVAMLASSLLRKAREH